MRRLAAALAEAPGAPTEFEGFLGSGSGEPLQVQVHRGIPVPFLQLSAPAPDSHLHPQVHAEDDEDAAADPDGLTYACLAPWGMETAHVGMPRLKKSKSKHATKSKCSATSSTLASPPPYVTSFPHSPSFPHDSGVEFGAFAVAQDDFDGTPGGLSTFPDELGVEADVAGDAGEAEVVRDALPSPGLSRGAGSGSGMAAGAAGRGWGRPNIFFSIRMDLGKRNSSLGWPWMRPSPKPLGYQTGIGGSTVGGIQA
ncbi:hypothetical protein B0H14DRAFT_2645061 [Mycena olivaceomarginata]|nr:hypothetical protein B0H14DRAFT_2645061 [Mycena olivaceomarginata]